MKCSSRRNCNIDNGTWAVSSKHASMKCSSRRNCNSPLSIARRQAPLRLLCERSVLGLSLSRPTLHLTSQNPRYFNIPLRRALPGDPRALEHSRQAMSGPSGVMVLVRPT